MVKNIKIVVGNWKMNPVDLVAAKEIYRAVKKGIRDLKKSVVFVLPPAIFLKDICLLNKNEKRLLIGAQDFFAESEGAFTGQLSLKMEMSSGGTVVLLGHSEKRKLGETDEQIAQKVFLALKNKLKTILCVGEMTRDEHGEYLNFLKNQIINGLMKVNRSLLSDLIIAYEPVWAIGQKETQALSATEMHEMAIFIRKIISDKYGRAQADSLPILYGGSVGINNAESIMKEGGVNGLLVGRESLHPETFVTISQIVDRS